MYTKWTAHCKTEQEKIQFESDLRRSKPVLERLKDILEQAEGSLDKNDTKFETASWAYLQAYTIGNRAALKLIKQLIDLDKQKDTNE